MYAAVRTDNLRGGRKQTAGHGSFGSFCDRIIFSRIRRSGIIFNGIICSGIIRNRIICGRIRRSGIIFNGITCNRILCSGNRSPGNYSRGQFCCRSFRGHVCTGKACGISS